MICLKNFSQVLDLFQKFMSTFREFTTAFELMNKFSVDITEKLHGSIKLPFKGNYYCLVELTNFAGIENFNNFVYSKFESVKLDDTELIIAKSEHENKKFLANKRGDSTSRKTSEKCYSTRRLATFEQYRKLYKMKAHIH